MIRSEFQDEIELKKQLVTEVIEEPFEQVGYPYCLSITNFPNDSGCHAVRRETRYSTTRAGDEEEQTDGEAGIALIHS